jgi:hypothetical protein
MRSSLLAAAIALLATAIAISHIRVAYPEEMLVRGVGTTTCAEFAKMVRNDPKNVERVFGSWAQGFMSGWNFALLEQSFYRDIGSESVEQTDFSIRQYCDTHPSATYTEAVMNVFSKMPMKAVPQSK